MPRPKKAATVKPPKPKLTPKQEHFARLVVRGYSQAEAYRRSYNVRPGSLPVTAWVNASALAAKHNVALRIAELTEQAARNAMVTRESMLVEMAENRALALDAGELGAATTSSRDRARVAGLMKDEVGDGRGMMVTIVIDQSDRSVL